MNKFTFLKVFNSPFITPKIKFYFGKIAYGVPYFFPRVWKNKPDKTGSYAVPKKIGFDFVGLGWKTKWDRYDIRHEWNPIWSFVFFKWQIAIIFEQPNYHYWECWLAYEKHTDKTKSPEERIKQAKEIFPCKWISYEKDGSQKRICYWDDIIKPKE